MHVSSEPGRSVSNYQTLMHALGIELRQYGITANAYAPGVIDTPLRESTQTTIQVDI